MELRQLEYLAALEQHGGFTAAAAVLHVAQPAVSHAIKKLEAEVGVELYDRGARRLTEAGRLLAIRGTRARSELLAAESELGDLKGLAAGTIRLGAIHWLAPFDLPATLGRFRRSHPNVTLSLVEDDAPAMLDRLQAGELDLVLHNVASDTTRAGTHRSTIVRERILVAVAGGDRWSARKRVSLGEVARRPMVAFRSGSAYRQYLDDAFADRDLNPTVSLESSDMVAVADLVASGLGVALLPQSIVEGRTDLVGLRTDPIVREVVLVWRTDHDLSPAAAALRDLLLEAAPVPSTRRRARSSTG